MPKKKIEEREEEVDVIKKEEEVKETFATRWFKDYAVNNASQLKNICDVTSRMVFDQFNIHILSYHNEVYGLIFYGTFISILEWLKEKEKVYNNYTITIANSINIGFTNNDDENNEKVGNFMPILEYVGINRPITDTDTREDNTQAALCMRWKELNGKKNEENYKEIQERANKKLLTDYKISLRTSEAVIPLFCIFMDNITNVIKLKFQEVQGTDVSEVSMNVFGLFDIFYSYDEEEDHEVIDFCPGIPMKTILKSDAIADRNN